MLVFNEDLQYCNALFVLVSVTCYSNALFLLVSVTCYSNALFTLQYFTVSVCLCP